MKPTIIPVIAAALVTAFTGIASCDDGDTSADFLRSRMTIGKNTTYLLEPVDASGHIDYIAALNKHLQKGVTADNNAAAFLAKAIGPKEFEVKLRSKYYALLGIAPLSAKGSYFIELSPFADESGQGDFYRKHLEDLDNATDSPWKSADFPFLAKWLSRNEAALDLAVQASRRPNYYEPMLSSARFAKVRNCPLPISQFARYLARTLAVRSMQKVGANDIDGAMNDLLAAHRIGRLVSQGPCLMQRAVGMAIQTTASHTTAGLFASGLASRKQCQQFLWELENLPKRKPLSAAVDLGERIMMLDNLSAISKGGIHELNKLGGVEDDDSTSNGQGKSSNQYPFDGTLHWCLDWDAASRIINRYFDNLNDAYLLPSYAQQVIAVNNASIEIYKLQEDWHTFIADKISMASSSGSPRRVLGETLGILICSLAEPPNDRMTEWGAHLQANDHCALISPLLAMYKLEYGAYPDNLVDLMHKTFREPPIDPFTLKPMHYVRTPTGCKFYSLGPNLRDDAGKYDDLTKADDWGVEMKGK